MYIHKNESRRAFLRQAGAFTAMVGSTAAPLAMNLAAIGTAAAQGTGDYKAIVCLFMNGGNDSFNMVLPTDSSSFSNYTATRDRQPDSIALLAPGTPVDQTNGVLPGSPKWLGGVIPLTLATGQSGSYALHPVMTGVQGLFNSQRLAVLPNVGPLLRPTTKRQLLNPKYPRPALLGSHNDQQIMWQSMGTEGTKQGWGGRMFDQSWFGNINNGSLFTAISTAGNAVWLAGDGVKQYNVNGTGAIALGVNTMGQVYESTTIGAAVLRAASTAHNAGNPFEHDVANMARRSIAAESALRLAMTPASDKIFGTAPNSGSPYSQAQDPKLKYISPLTGVSAANGLAQQFQTVARLIDAGMGGGLRRQIFFVEIGGFDTHSLQNGNHADLLARVDQGLKYFNDTLEALGAARGKNVSSMVTTFTASEFGRTFTSNGDGTDHGWGSHHFVMGGAVQGGRLYGRFPTLGVKNLANSNFDSSDDQLGSGSLLPTTSVDQLGATLARWFGATDSEVLSVFPNLQHWGATARYLKFFG